MNVLTVDIGNSKIKLDIWNDDGHICHEESESSTHEKIDSLIEEHDVEGASICSVGQGATDLYSYLKTKLDGKVSHIDSATTNLYNVEKSYREELGADRLAAYIGALTLIPGKPVLIVDAGTAMTVDVVNEEKKFCGGNISLGIRNRLKALHEYTARLPKVEPAGDISLFGTNTESAMRSGAVGGAVGEILYDFDNAHHRYKVSTILFTGGDASLLIPLIEKKGIEILYDPYLVSRGLNANFRHFYLN